MGLRRRVHRLGFLPRPFTGTDEDARCRGIGARMVSGRGRRALTRTTPPRPARAGPVLASPVPSRSASPPADAPLLAHRRADPYAVRRARSSRWRGRSDDGGPAAVRERPSGGRARDRRRAGVRPGRPGRTRRRKPRPPPGTQRRNAAGRGARGRRRCHRRRPRSGAARPGFALLDGLARPAPGGFPLCLLHGDMRNGVRAAVKSFLRITSRRQARLSPRCQIATS